MSLLTQVKSLDLPDWRYGLGLFAAAMLYVWHPFSGGARAPSAILFLLGLFFWATAWKVLSRDLIQRRWIYVVGCLAIPNLLSLPASYSMEHTISRLGLIFAVWVVGSVLIEILKNTKALDLLRVVLAITAAVWILDALVQMIVGVDLIGIPKEGKGDWARVVGFYGNHLYLPWSLLLGLPVLIWCLLPRRPYLALSALLLGGVVIVGTGVRSALVSWLVVAFFVFLHLKVRFKWMLVPILLIGLSVAIAFSPLAKQKLAQTSLSGVSFEQLNELLSYRLYLWESAWYMVKDRPVVGVGGDAFRSAYGDYSLREGDLFTEQGRAGSQNVHQLYLSVLAETGIVGFGALMLLIGVLVRWYFSASSQNRDKARPYAIGLVAVSFPINSQPLIYKTWWVPLLVLFVAALLSTLGRGQCDQDVTD